MVEGGLGRLPVIRATTSRHWELFLGGGSSWVGIRTTVADKIITSLYGTGEMIYGYPVF